MKKFLISLVLFLVLPFSVHAAQLGTASISGPSTKKVGDNFSVIVKIPVSGLQKGDEQTLGIWFVNSELKFDDTALQLTSISATSFTSKYGKIGENYYIVSEVLPGLSSTNYCAYGSLYCGEYVLALNFTVTTASETDTTIQLGELEVDLLDAVDSEKVYTEEDMISLEATSNQSHTIHLNSVEKPSTPSTTPPVVTPPETPNVDSPSTTSPNEPSANSFLKSLEIESYPISFDKNKKNYTISLKEEVNQLVVKAEAEEEQSHVTILGADDLKAHQNKVVVEVTAPDQTKSTYTIEVTPYKTEAGDKKEKVDSNFLLLIGGIGGGFLLILIVGFIITKIKGRKIDKMLDDL